MNKLEKTIEEYRLEFGITQRDMAFRLGLHLNTYLYQSKTNTYALSTIDLFCREFGISKLNIDFKRKGDKK